MAGQTTPATIALGRAKVAYTLHRYDHTPGTTAFGAEAVAALGLDPQRTFKTLIAVTPTGELLCAMVPVGCQLDLRALAGAHGAKSVGMADAAAAERATGYVVGGISPLGQKKRLASYLDASALAFPTVFCSAGRRGLELELAPADLVALTHGVVVALARRP